MVETSQGYGQAHALVGIIRSPRQTESQIGTGEMEMNEPIVNTQAQAQSYLDKAEMYKKLGLKAQVRYELGQARNVDPYVVQEDRYKTLLEEAAAEEKKFEALKTPLRIGAGMVFLNAVLGAFFLVLILISGGGTDLGSGDLIAPIVSVIIGVNLWNIKKQWQVYAVWWAALGLVFFGAGALISGDYFSLIAQLGFSGSLILLLAGTPTKARTIAAVAIYLLLYVGMICLLFTLSFLGVV
jgi:hypothetical protein